MLEQPQHVSVLPKTGAEVNIVREPGGVETTVRLGDFTMATLEVNLLPVDQAPPTVPPTENSDVGDTVTTAAPATKPKQTTTKRKRKQTATKRKQKKTSKSPQAKKTQLKQVAANKHKRAAKQPKQDTTTKHKKQKRVKKNKPPLDKPSSSTTTGGDKDAPNPFNVHTILSSFANPKDDLFDRALQAELEKHPELIQLTPKHVKDTPPAVLYRSRLKGYYCADRLCRIWVLETLEKARSRGEWFVHFRKLASDNSHTTTHDGTLVFAFFFTVYYLSIHDPAMSLQFHRDGSLKTTSIFIENIRLLTYDNHV